MRKEKWLEWFVQGAVMAFSAGGAYFMLKDHDKRIEKVENKQEHCLTREDFSDYKRELRLDRVRRGQ